MTSLHAWIEHKNDSIAITDVHVWTQCHVIVLPLPPARDEVKIGYIEAYLRAAGLFRDYTDPSTDPAFSECVELDLGGVVPSLSGPKRPHDRVSVSEMKQDFQCCLDNKVRTVLHVYTHSLLILLGWVQRVRHPSTQAGELCTLLLRGTRLQPHTRCTH